MPQNIAQQSFYDRDGNHLRVLASAFFVQSETEGPLEGHYRISVDRANLRGSDPTQTSTAMTSRGPHQFAVVCIPAGEARAVPEVENIVPDPLPDNPAHALICVVYELGLTKNGNKRLMREAAAQLADIANSKPWAILPADPGGSSESPQ